MNRHLRLSLLFFFAPLASFADDPVTLKNVAAPAENSKDEPLAKSFSLDKALHFLDSAALHWQKKQACFSCHTNYAYLYARPLIDAKPEAHQEVRRFAEELVSERWKKKGPRWDAEVICAASALAFNDAHTTGKLQPLTRTALERIWTVQKKDGGFKWLKCEWPPMESDDHYGVTLAAIAVGVAPEGYARSDAAEKGMAGIRAYLKKNPPPTVHHKAMVLWAATYHADLLSEEERKETLRELMELQRPDGGWAAASMGNWKRGDAKAQDKETSDGYGTGFSLYVLHRAKVGADDPRVKSGLAWLKANQRESGRWFTRSLYRDNKHYLSHAGSAFAVMALAVGEK
jgi:squalene-hopene/tetraprenyl-beta-curcumene cyclase